jgi:3-hydroxyisobutyrate dehydrogenase
MSTIPATPPRLAVLGTGIMGGAMARRWAGHGHAVTAWNRHRAKAEALADAGVVAVATPAEAVAGADVVVTMLADGPATEAVMAEALPAVAPGALWVQMGTVGVEATDRLAALAGSVGPAGLAFVDAPVSGTKRPAEQGLLTVLAGGPEAVRDRADAVFAPVAARVEWVGDVGAGTRLKLVVNAWLAALLAGLAESIALAEGLGLDPRRFLATIEGGPLGSGYATVKGAMMLDRSYPVAFPLHLLAKDVDLVAAAASTAGVPLRLPAAVADLLAAAAPDHGDDDMAALVEAFRR